MTAKMVDSKDARPSDVRLSPDNKNQTASGETRSMPDIAKTSNAANRTTLDWVGMHNIALPIFLDSPKQSDHTQSGQSSKPSLTQVSATVTAYVNLNNPEVRGIHMSRLYLLLMQYAETQSLSPASLRTFIDSLLNSHTDISDQAYVEIAFNHLIKQPALVSNNSGWKAYPVKVITLLKEKKVQQELRVSVPYSSTCPCSAALARQLLQEKFDSDHGHLQTISTAEVSQWLRSENGTFATPHSQRSLAEARVKLEPSQNEFPIEGLIQLIEDTLKTPVQTAVKREDEQEFAHLNGQNLMFCEDAARRLKNAFNQQAFVDFWIKVNHLESLHAHDAVALATKGLPDGYTPDPNL